MRISSNQIFQQGLNSILDNQNKLSRTQMEISSGRKLLNSSDDPIGAVRSVELETAIARGERYISNGEVARTRLSEEESAVSNAILSLQRIHELALQANNASQSNETRGIIAGEIREQLDNLLRLANSRDASGGFLFSGFQEDAEPFSLSNGTTSYHGDDGRRELQIGPSRTVTDGDPGSAVFMGILRGNGEFVTGAGAGNTGAGIIDGGTVTDPSAWDGDSYRIVFTGSDTYEIRDSANALVDSGDYTPREAITFAGVSVTISGEPAAGDEFTVEPSDRTDVFALVDALANSLDQERHTPAGRAAQSNEINTAISDLGQALDHLVNRQTSIGTRLNAIEQQAEINSGANLQLQETLSGITDVDIVEASARFSQTLLNLQASQQAFARTQQLSLFNFL